MKRILVRPEICSGCRACEIACVARHDGRFGTATARIHVTKIEARGVDHPHVCRLCRKPACLAACPSGALRKDPATGAVLVQADRCIGCAACVDACPFGMAALHLESGVALICDLCEGDPACVARCATGAIVYAEEGLAVQEKRRRLAGDHA